VVGKRERRRILNGKRFAGSMYKRAYKKIGALWVSCIFASERKGDVISLFQVHLPSKLI
jgi:hypothetical protein